MMVRPPTHLQRVVSILGVLAVALAGRAGYQGLAVVSLVRHARAEKTLLRQEQVLKTQLRQAQATTATLRSQVPIREASWSWSQQLPVMIGQVSELVKHSGVRVESMQPAPVAAAEKLQRFPLRLAMQGDLAAVVVFLRLARGQSPALSVDQLILRTGAQAADPLRAEVTLSSYVVLEGAVRGEKR